MIYNQIRYYKAKNGKFWKNSSNSKPCYSKQQQLPAFANIIILIVLRIISFQLLFNLKKFELFDSKFF